MGNFIQIISFFQLKVSCFILVWSDIAFNVIKMYWRTYVFKPRSQKNKYRIFFVAFQFLMKIVAPFILSFFVQIEIRKCFNKFFWHGCRTKFRKNKSIVVFIFKIFWYWLHWNVVQIQHQSSFENIFFFKNFALKNEILYNRHMLYNRHFQSFEDTSNTNTTITDIQTSLSYVYYVYYVVVYIVAATS